MSYQDRLALAMSQSEFYKTATALAKALGCSAQAVGMVLSGSSKSFAATNHSKASALLKVVPTWLANGEGPMREMPQTPRLADRETALHDPVLDDLDVLEPEDADVWRAQIRAAATKVRREKAKQMAETADFAPKPPTKVEQLVARAHAEALARAEAEAEAMASAMAEPATPTRTQKPPKRNPQAVDHEIEAAVPPVKP